MEVRPSLKVKFNNDFQIINNSEFVQGSALIAYPGDNRNGSDITGQAFNDAMPSLSLIPVVGHWLPEKQNFGGHDITVEWSGNELILKENTVPYGVVKENHNAEWVEIIENGEKHNYLKADVVLWYGRYQEQIQKVIDEGINQSMEINVSKFSKKENGNIQIDSFEYSALCLLGKEIDEFGNKGDNNVEPCFESASVIIDKFTVNDKFKEQFNQLLFAMNNVSPKGGETNQMSSKKEDEKLDEKLKLIAKYNLTVEQLNFNIEELSLEELEEKLKEFSIKDNADDDKVELLFSATYRQKQDALDNALDPIVARDENKELIEETYFWLCDFDDEYVFVQKNYWTPNDYECTYGRAKYTFDEITITATVDMDSWEEMVKVWLTEEENQRIQNDRNALETMSTEIETFKSKILDFEATVSNLQKENISLKTSNEELTNYKNNNEKNIHVKEINEVFLQFEEELKDNQDYITFKEKVESDVMNYSVDVVDEKLSAIYGKLHFAKNNKTKEKVTAIVIEDDNNKNTNLRYGQFEKFVIKNN